MCNTKWNYFDVIALDSGDLTLLASCYYFTLHTPEPVLIRLMRQAARTSACVP